MTSRFILVILLIAALEGDSIRAREPQASAPEKASRRDAFGDPLPPGAVARLGSMRFRHGGGGASAIAFSPDGKLLASVGSDNSLRVWDMATGQEVKCFRCGQNRGNISVAFSPDGKTLAVGSRCSHSVTGDPVGEIFSLWDLSTGKLIRSMKASRLQQETPAVAFSADGKRLAICTEQLLDPEKGLIWPVKICDTRTGELLAEYRPFKHRRVEQLAFSPDGKMVAAICDSVAKDDDGLIHLWDVPGRKELPPLKGHKGTVFNITFSSRGKLLASAGVDNTFRLWDVGAAKEVERIPAEGEDYGRFVGFAADGKTQVRAGGGALHVWDVEAKKELRVLKGDCGTTPAHAALSPDGTVLAVTTVVGRPGIALFDTRTGKRLHSPPGHRAAVSSLAFLPDCRTVATAAEDGTVRVWEAATGKELRCLEGHALAVLAPDGRIFGSKAAPGDTSIRICDLDTGKKLREVPDPPDNPRSPWPQYSFSPDGKYLFAGGTGVDGRAKPTRLWDVATAKQVFEFPLDGYSRGSPTFSPDGKLVALDVAGSRGPHFWDLEKRKPVGVIPRSELVNRFIFSPAGKVGAAISGNSRALYDLESGQAVWTVYVPRDEGWTGAVFSPDGRTIATGTVFNEEIILWEAATGQERGRIKGLDTSVGRLVFSPDGHMLAAWQFDCAPLIWDVTGRVTEAPYAKARLKDADLDALWADLADTEDATKAWRAVRTLIGHPEQAVAVLEQKLPRQAEDHAQWLGKRIADLNSDDAEVRDQASRKLEAFGKAGETALKKALKHPSLEVRRRSQDILDKLAKAKFDGSELRATRGIEALEYIGTPEARRALEALAKGKAEDRLTQEAKAALARLDKRPQPKR